MLDGYNHLIIAVNGFDWPPFKASSRSVPCWKAWPYAVVAYCIGGVESSVGIFLRNVISK
jgi:hypothetical protein